MKIENKNQTDDITITTTEETISYYSTEWDYIQYDSEFIYIKFVETHPEDCILYNKDQVINIEIG